MITDIHTPAATYKATNGSSPNRFASDEARYASFGKAIHALQRETFAKVGQDDLAYVTRMHHFARAMEVAGRTILHFSFEPITFTLGVFTLFLSKQVDATEIGHTVLHGAYDKVDTKGKFQSRKYWWPAPIDEESWRRGHNVRHHMNTNIAGKDPDVEFGPVRLTERTPHRPEHYIQLPFTLFALFPNFAFLMNLHFTGVVDLIGPARHAPPRILEDRSPESKRQAWRRLLRK
jgi:linoleoyl-CoA desaturase